MIHCYFEQITGFLKTVGSVAMPLAMGCGIAYVLNIIMSAMERHYFTRKNAPWVEKTRRPVCMAACIVAVLGIIFLLIRVVAPELINAVLLLGEGVPVYVEKRSDMGCEPQRRDPCFEGMAGKSCHRLAQDHPAISGKPDGYPEFYRRTGGSSDGQYRAAVYESDLWNLSLIGKKRDFWIRRKGS